MNDIDVGRERLLQVFRFLQAFNERKNPPKRQIREQQALFWLRDLPVHDCVQLAPDAFQDPEILDDDSEGEAYRDTTDYILRVRRPVLRPPPAPPDELLDWLREGWDNPEREVSAKEELEPEEESGPSVRFEDDPGRSQLLRRWLQERDKWAQSERPARAAMHFFERLYEVHATVERESEQVELVLGDGILNWRRGDGGIHHPILLQRLQIEFDPDIPEFFVRETDSPVELYTSLFRSVSEVDGQIIDRLRRDTEAGGLHPLGGQRTSEWFERAVHQLSVHGEYVADAEPIGEADYPRLGRQTVIFLRRRSLGFAAAIESILEDLPTRDDLPSSLLRIVGIDTGEVADDVGDETREQDDDDILLTKPANQEQVRIARRLEKHRAVLVQGPPGTGKTHTIANLIGHLLAQGKKVLVTSHTTKALRVLRDHVEEELQPLCVSVLDTDIDSRSQLEDSIHGTVERLSDKDNIERYRADDRALSRERARLLRELRETREQLLHARDGEYREIVVAGNAYSPADAGRHVAANAVRDAWIPSPVVLNEALPLSPEEVRDLYQSNLSLSLEDEAELGGELPDPSVLLTADAFARAVEDVRRSEGEAPSRTEFWERDMELQGPDALGAVIQRAEQAVGSLQGYEPWRLAAIDAGLRSERDFWDALLVMIEDLTRLRSEAQPTALRFDLEYSAEQSLDEQEQVLADILSQIGPDGRVGGLAMLLRRRWRRVLRSQSVDGKSPRSAVHVDALLRQIQLAIRRDQLRARWLRQMEPLGAQSLSETGEPERMAAEYAPRLVAALDWAETTYRPLERDLKSCGLNLEAIRAITPPQAGLDFDALSLRTFILGAVLPECRRRHAELEGKRAKDALARLREHLSAFADSDIVASLLRAIREMDAEGYGHAFNLLAATTGKEDDLRTRQDLLARLERAAPRWAEAIHEREPPHDRGEPPGDPQPAWLWRQLSDELDARSGQSLDGLQSRVNALKVDLEQTTRDLVSMRAWTRQIERTTHGQQMALVGFSQLVRRIGRGTGKRAPRLKLEAQRKLTEARDAVPVWIMPLSRVVDNLDPRSTEFDVVIIDEASQSDALALIALYLGKSVVVVGDHEQVTPDAIGQKVAEVEQLIDTHLQGIPNAELYDGQLSIYHMAQAAFGGLIRLVEHFRCAPDIINFSNGLSYNWAIRPLRDPGNISLHPHVVEHCVRGSQDAGNVNEAEAEAVASLVTAAIEQPEYEGKTFGVVSLVSSGGQVRAIESLLIRHLQPADFEKRRIICGNPAHFQGDERDVMFLSMVYGPQENGPLARLGDPDDRLKKRYNVAASRARDQMWLVHSLDPDVDLKSDDLRKRLIDHARDPRALVRLIEEKVARAESPLEKRVLERLVTAGYDVRPQYSAGYYRIDIVIKDQQIAIECDGDKFHPPEKLREDMERQLVLERLGWRFVRIRGTQFYRDSDGTMARVFERLQELGAEPRPVTQGDPGLKSSELIERVRRRAAEIRARWRGTTWDAEAGSPDEGANSQVEAGSVTEVVEDPHAERRAAEEPIGDEDEGVDEYDEGEPREAPPVEPRGASLLRAIRDRTADLLTPKSSGTEQEAADRAIAYARERGLRIVDKRPSGGALWIVCGPEHKEVLHPLGFQFSANGGRASSHQPAWFKTG